MITNYVWGLKMLQIIPQFIMIFLINLSKHVFTSSQYNLICIVSVCDKLDELNTRTVRDLTDE